MLWYKLGYSQTRGSGGWACIAHLPLAKKFQRRRFFNESANQKQDLSGSLFLSHWDEMGKLCKGLSMDALHQILINFTQQFQPIRNKNYLWQPCLVSDQDKIRKLYKGTSTDAPVQKLIHLAKQFQRRWLLTVSTNQKHE